MSETTTHPWDTLPSIWDGWTHKACGHYLVVAPNQIHYCCATGYLIEIGKARVVLSTVASCSCCLEWLDAETQRRFEAVDKWLRHHDLIGVIWANDKLNWTPDQFRELDRRLEYETHQSQLARQINAIKLERANAEAARDASPVGGNSKNESSEKTVVEV